MPQIVNTKNRLLQYATFSAAFLAMHKNATAQVNYVDLDPDVVRDVDGPFPHLYNLDLDGDGTLDMHFRVGLDLSNISGFGYTHILVAPFWQNSLGGVAGSVYTTQYWNVPVGMAFRLESDDVISEENTFFSAGNVNSTSYYLNAFFGIVPAFENQINFWEADSQPHFIGVRFGIAGQPHYGWVRCTIENNFRKLIIHDYAYNATANEPIIAGNVTSTVSGSPVIESEPEIFLVNDYLIIQLPKPADACEIVLTDITGKTFFLNTFSGSLIRIPLSELPGGISIVCVRNGNSLHTGKIFIEYSK